jgi:serine/threonine protein phosphatase PrpC
MQNVEFVAAGVPLLGGAHSEDVYVVTEAQDGRPFCVFMVDGHGREHGKDGKRVIGSSVVRDFVRDAAELLTQGFRVCPDAYKFCDLFACVDRELESRYTSCKNWEVGAVVSCVVVLEDRLVCAQAGDCRLYRTFGGPSGFMLLTQDHNPHNPREARRLNALVLSDHGLTVLDLDTLVGFPQTRLRLYQKRGKQLYGGLRVTRGFGDWGYRPAFTSEPEVREYDYQRAPQGTVFALCSDGANNVVEKVMKSVRGRNVGEVELEYFKRETLSRLDRPQDDATVVYFRVLD